MRVPGELKSSANAGELSPGLKGKVNIKQYYNGALAMKNIEPVPQSGFTLGPSSRHVEIAASAVCRYGVLEVDANLSYLLVFTVGEIRVFRNSVTRVATLAAAWVTAELLPQLSFFGEANTFGVWHEDLRTRRLYRDPVNDSIWSIDDWPYTDIPEVDLGGVYIKTTDKWQFYVRFTGDTIALVMSISIEGNKTDGVTLKNTVPVTIQPGAATTTDWNNFASALQTEARLLPGMSAGLSLTYDAASSSSGYAVFAVTFGGSLDGDEYQFDANILNTADASVLSSHIQTGKTAGEVLVSAAKGWFAGMDLFQDRAIYFGARARRASVSMSKVAAYFTLNIKDQADNGARLEALRTISSEQILHVLEGKYLLVFTDKAEWFATNRTIVRNEPVNFVRTTENGCRPNCRPQVLEGFVWYVNKDGSVLYSTSYDDVSTSFLADPESLLATHLIAGVKRMGVQKKVNNNNVSRLWMLRDDGRLIYAVVIKSQEIMAVVEWIPAGGGLVKEIAIDGQQRVSIAVQRGSVVTQELLEEAGQNVFHNALTVSTDLTGVAGGLSLFNGKSVWARINGYLFGPFTVTGGQIQTEENASSAIVGLWQPPNFESMPFVKVMQDNSILQRPGRVHTINLALIDTESIAVGANGSPPKNVSLAQQSDDLTQSPKPFNGKKVVSGINGVIEGPTVRITQTRPGLLRVRDYLPGVKL
jgi:hypothetical protein